MAAAAYFLAILLVASPLVIHAVEHDVGGNTGWSENTDLTAWASNQIFTVGDTIVFFYNSHHKVDIVTEDDYNNCNGANPIKSYSKGVTSITLDKVGPVYFIDPTPGRCQAGMKLAIEVTGTSGTSNGGDNSSGGSSQGGSATLPPGVPSAPGAIIPGKPIGHLIPKPEGANARRLNFNDFALGVLLVVVMLLTYV